MFTLFSGEEEGLAVQGVMDSPMGYVNEPPFFGVCLFSSFLIQTTRQLSSIWIIMHASLKRSY